MLNKGLKMNNAPVNGVPGSWVKARNIMYSNLNDAILGEFGGEQSISITGIILGFEVTPKFIVVWSYDDSDLASPVGKIYIVTANSSSLVFTDASNWLDLDIVYPITAHESYVNAVGNVVCTFSDKKPKAGNRSKIIVLDGTTGAILNDGSANEFERFPSANIPTIRPIIDFNGTLLSGTYYVTIQYETLIGVRTNWTIPSRPINIGKGDLYFAEYEGLEKSTVSNESINIELTNVDIDFTYIRFGIVYNNGSGITFNLLDSVPINGTSMIYTFADNAQLLENLSILELTAKKPAFVNIGAEAQLNKIDYIADLSTYEDKESTIQQVANSIIIHSSVQWEDLNSSGHKKPDYTSFQSREVYAFYLHFIRPDWTITRGFHIPGRARIIGLDNAMTTNDYPKAGYAFRYYDTISPTLAAPVYANDTINNGGNPPTAATRPIGHMCYWENEDEFYPNLTDYPSTGSLTTDANGNMAVRHHKFPSINSILDWAITYYGGGGGGAAVITADTGATTVTEFGVRYFPKLGFITQSDISWVSGGVDLKDYYIGAVISYANRNGNNSLVIGQDIWHQCANETGITDISNTTGNWNLSLNGGASRNYVKNTDYIKLHSYSLLKNRLQVPNNIFTALEYRFILESFDVAAGSHPAGSQPQSGFRNTGDALKHTAFCNYSHALTTSDIDFVVANSVIDLTNVEYVPVNVDKSYDGLTILNTYGEEFVIAKLDDHTAAITLPTIEWEVSRIIPIAAVAVEDGEDNGGADVYNVFSYLHTLQRYYTNVYLSFLSQQLAITANGAGQSSIDISTITRFGDSGVAALYPVFGGDTFVGRNSIISHSNANLGALPTGFDGNKTIHLYPCESRFNLNMRYEADYLNSFGINNSLYVPKTGYEQDTEFNWLLTERHSWGAAYEFYQEVMYDVINNVESLSIWNPKIQSFNNYPVRIARSLPYSLDNIDCSSWSQFPIADYYDHVADFGTIWILKKYQDKLLIHHTKGLFITRSIGRLQADGTVDVTITSGDIFDVMPTPLMTTEGEYVGCQSKWGNYMTEFGYFFVDLSKGRVYQLSGEGLSEISIDNRDWFETYFKQVNAELYDNPFRYTTSGIEKAIVGYDEQYGRILINARKEIYTNYTNNAIGVNTYSLAIGSSKQENLLYYTILTSAAVTSNITLTLVDSVSAATQSYGVIIPNATAINNKIEGYIVVPFDLTTFKLDAASNFTLSITVKIMDTSLYNKTISYKPSIKQWVSEHDYFPRMFASFSNVLFSSTNTPAIVGSNSFITHNVQNLTYKGRYHDSAYRYSWFVDALYNDSPKLTKVLQSVNWQSIVKPLGNTATQANRYDKTVSHIAIYNDNQCSGEIELVNPNYYVNSNNRFRGGEWTFNQFRDLVSDKRTIFIDNNGKILISNITNNKSYFEKSKFIGKFVIVRFKHNNNLEISGVRYDVRLTDITVNARLV